MAEQRDLLKIHLPSQQNCQSCLPDLSIASHLQRHYNFFFQLTEEAERNVNKSRALLDDIVRENKGIFSLKLIRMFVYDNSVPCFLSGF